MLARLARIPWSDVLVWDVVFPIADVCIAIVELAEKRKWPTP